ncbi:MAG TPA: hypothetical protein VFH85_00165, partial [Gammaproteobacteria bacterium]|nr:hypothetical protein [Gammaproteobacteria bacterium]
MEAAVVASSDYLLPLSDGEPPPSLTNALRESCRNVPRRVDRFIQLALLGSARCAAGRALRHDCGIYLGSG